MNMKWFPPSFSSKISSLDPRIWFAIKTCDFQGTRLAVASRFVWKFGAALPVPLADALSRRTTIVDLCHSG